MEKRSGLILVVSTLGLLGGVSAAAHATPYAFASNQITGLTVTFVGGGSITATTATTSISDSAQFDGYGITGNQTSGTVGSASTIAQAYSGPGPAPAATYTPQAPGTFTGARSDASIGAGSASSGGVSVSNVAAAYGNSLGNSVGTNNAAISFSLVGTGQAVAVNFNDLIQLIASTSAVPGQTANSSIQNNLSITAIGATTPLATFSPSVLNQQLSSAAGVPPSNSVGPTSYSETFTTPVLTVGTLYTLALTSTASETILPGTPVTPVSTPEPASLAVLTAALGLFGFARWRRG